MIIIELYLVFLKLGLFSFGGGYVMIPLIRSEVLESREWITTAEFLDIIAIAEMSPGPISINAATFVGYNLGGIPGSIAATLGVLTPALVLVIMVTRYFLKYQHTACVQCFCSGIRPVIIGMVLAAGIMIGLSAIENYTGLAIAGLIFGLSIYKNFHPILLIGLAGLIGVLVF